MNDDTDFGKWLVSQRLLSKDDLRRVLNAQRGRMGRLDTEIIDLQLMSESATLDALGKFNRTRTVSGSELEYASPSAIRMITPRIASRLGVVPFKLEGKTLSVATLSPGDLLVEDEIAQLTGCMVASFVALEIRFVEALNWHYQAPVTARYAGLVRRLSGVREAVKETPRHSSMAEVDATPPSTPVPGIPRPVVETQRRTAPKPADSLELSAEERDLFPSLRDEEAEAAADPRGISGEVALVREDQPAAPVPTDGSQKTGSSTRSFLTGLTRKRWPMWIDFSVEWSERQRPAAVSDRRRLRKNFQQ